MTPRPFDLSLARTVAEVAVRVGLLLALAAWCFWLVRPFITPLLWGTIIAIAVHPGYVRLRDRLGGRGGLAATLLTLLGVVLLIWPLSVLTMSLIDTVGAVTGRLSAGLSIQPPPARLSALPIVGEPIERLWRLASINLNAALAQIGPQLRAVAGWLLSLVADAGFSLLKFVAALVIAGLLLAHSAAGARAVDALAIRLVGERGPALASLAGHTIRNVTRGLLGTALVQAILAGLGFVVVGVPAAAFLALIVFLLCVVQLGAAFVLLPVVIWVFSAADTLTAVLFLVWSVLVAVLDQVLRPYLMSRGGDVPVVVILIGVLGGLLAHGLIGLFIGPIVFALGYEMFRAWVEGDTQADRAPEPGP